jgi:hypothetical protein
MTMKKYEKGYHDAQWEMANRLYECYLNKYIFGMNWQMIEYITGLSLDDLEKLLFEYDEKLTAACLAESDSLEEKIYRLHIERYSNEYIQEQLGVTEEKIRLVIEGKDGCCKDVYNMVYQKLKAKKHKNIAEYRYYRNFTIGQKTGYEEVRWEWVQRLHTAGMNEDKISEILTYPQKEVERLLIMKKEDIKGWVEDHWQDEN